MDQQDQARLYASVAQEAAAVVIRRYSTSFLLATRLLEKPVRRHVENIYALVRIADECVDGACAGSGSAPEAVRACLVKLEEDTIDAVQGCYSSNLVVHAFALTARAVGIGPELVRPFFASMRADLARSEHTRESFDEYVYGSAEVVGMMCVRAFLQGRMVNPGHLSRLEDGARRLGAAFQKINFLRDLADDFQDLGRSYFPGISVEEFSDTQKDALLAEITDDLAAAQAVIAELPAGSRTAVAAVHALFAELARRLGAAPARELLHRRVRVPDAVKLRLVAAAWYGQRTTPRQLRLRQLAAAAALHRGRA
ncbi:squalene/phytoene synthase family protein [Arthrobacter alkaliphilus]|uniref:phytoene/squalene synthase family protein n=1 Tax=Arthrobacter alkaliphilus TaxID=369936 RepID=UPI001F1A0851|nr:squalene/phytoene synthase family protein [Arthrobacter alkaliphilus]